MARRSLWRQWRRVARLLIVRAAPFFPPHPLAPSLPHPLTPSPPHPLIITSPPLPLACCSLPTAADLRVGSLYQLAAMHSYLDLWPANMRTLEALAEPVDPPAPEAPTGPAAPTVLGGGGGGPMVVPNLAGCVEYTGQTLDLDASAILSANVTAEDSSFAPAVPFAIEAFLEALPRRVVGAGLPPPSSYDIQALSGRLHRLPESLNELPTAATALCGSLDQRSAPSGGASAAEVTNQRPSRDPFTARQRKARAEGFTA